MSRDTGEVAWERGWDGHHRMQQRRLAKLTLPEKLEWLEQAQQIVESLGMARGERSRMRSLSRGVTGE